VTSRSTFARFHNVFACNIWVVISTYNGSFHHEASLVRLKVNLKIENSIITYKIEVSNLPSIVCIIHYEGVVSRSHAVEFKII